MVSKDLAPKVRGVTRVQDAGCSPHWPIRLVLDGSATRYLVQKVAKPSMVPAALPRAAWAVAVTAAATASAVVATEAADSGCCPRADEAEARQRHEEAGDNCKMRRPMSAR